MGGWEIPRNWRLKKQRYGLVGEVCRHCDNKSLAPRDACPNCGEAVTTLDMLVDAQTKEDQEMAARIAFIMSHPEVVG